jgi:hypothetical protein
VRLSELVPFVLNSNGERLFLLERFCGYRDLGRQQRECRLNHGVSQYGHGQAFCLKTFSVQSGQTSSLLRRRSNYLDAKFKFTPLLDDFEFGTE